MKLRAPGEAAAIVLVTGAIFLASPVRIATDSRYSVLVSEALLRHHSFVLDQWFGGSATLPYQVEAVGEHVYSWYPPGGPVLATPFVWVMARLGLSAVGRDGAYVERNEIIVQALLAALFMAVLSAIILKTARSILTPHPAGWGWIVALGAALGTQIWTTASRALWGDTFLVLVVGGVTWLLVLVETGRRRLPPVLLATLLAWGYFARPTASIAVLAVTLYVGLHHRRLIVPYLATGIGWMAAFVVYSRLTFGTSLPTYYRMSTFGLRTFWSGLLGILVSPSRGQLIFVPVTLFVAYLVARYRRSLPLPRLVAPALVAVLGHVGLIASFEQWHGGHSYGPRYLTPLVPWLALLAAIGLRALLERRARGMRIEIGAGAVLLACSVLVQARGAFVRETWTWNTTPNNVSLHPDRVWDWRNPQALAGLIEAPAPAAFPALVPGDQIDFGSARAESYLVSGWSGGEGAFRWTDGRAADTVFGLDTTPASVEPLVLEMELEPFIAPRRARRQRVKIQLNGTDIETLRLDGPGRTRIAIRLPPDHLGRENRLRFGLPDATFAAPFGLGGDPRQLGVAVYWLRLRRPSG